jgi:hypothetical protein
LKTSVVPNLNQFGTASQFACDPDAFANYNTVGVGQLSIPTTLSSADYTIPQFSIPGNSIYPYLVV